MRAPPFVHPLCLIALFLIRLRCLAELEPIAAEKINEVDGVDHVLMSQRISNGRVTLLPEHCFFSGDSKNLKLSGPSKSPTADPLGLNAGNSYASVDGLQSPSQKVVWPLWLSSEGTIHGKIISKGSGSLTVKLGAMSQTVSPAGGTVEFKFEKTPRGQVELSVNPKTFSGSIERIELDGPALKDAKLLRARWRPAAIHSSFTSSNLGKEESRLWIMEVRPHQIEKDFYSPITTPFGYFGSTFNADGSSGGINFSMWSYEAGKEEPPIAQLSHLLSVGSQKASFGGFGHEGTGVKLRDWNPYEGLKVASGALALRLDPGKPYDTYTAYFYDQTLETWRLFASGRKWSQQRGTQNLLPGCFVEVPGPPHVERSGQIVRTADFRGWCRDSKGIWHHLDKMQGDKADASREQTNCLWARSDDNWFRMSIGGLLHFRYPKSADIQIPKFNSLPPFLSPDKVKVLDENPTTVRFLSTRVQGDSLVGELEVNSLSRTPSKVTAFYGPTDALSFSERWEKKTELGEMTTGKHHFKITGVPRSGFLRIQVKNETGIFFTHEPSSWK